MPKAQRSPEEIQDVRERIMHQALALITTDGFNNFSMRKLAARLGIAAKTIYNYFQNQDELYLFLHIKGFEQLFDRIIKATRLHKQPMDKIGAQIEAFIDFGLENPDIYNLMFTWEVPRYNEYIGTPMEGAAQRGLDASMKITAFSLDLYRQYLGDSPAIDENKLRVIVIHAFTPMHGYLTATNSSVLLYEIDDPVSLKNAVIERVFNNIQSDLKAYRQRIGLSVVSD